MRILCGQIDKQRNEMTTCIKTSDLADDWYKDCPAWAKEELPEEMALYRGVAGFDKELRESMERVMQGGPNAACVAGVDLYHSNFFIPYRKETAEYLYTNYTPTIVHWPKGYLPLVYSIANKAIVGKQTVEEKVQGLMNKFSQCVLHPSIPPLGDNVPANRNLDEDELIEDGTAWCNEQARVMTRACQAVGIPARLIHLFYKQFPSAHAVMEFFNGKKWCLLDASYWLVFPDKQGFLMSTAECHDSKEGQQQCRKMYQNAIKSLIDQDAKSTEGSGDQRFQRWVEEHRQGIAENKMQLRSFAVMNYPLPREAEL